MTLTEMRALLAKRDIQLTKSLGQNFLHSPHYLHKIVDAAEIKTGNFMGVLQLSCRAAFQRELPDRRILA